MLKSVRQVKNEEQIELGSKYQASNLDDSQYVNESQETLGALLQVPCMPTDRTSLYLAFLAAIICLAIFVIVTLSALLTQNLFLLSIIPIMVGELTYLFRRAIDFLLPKNSTRH